MLALAVSVFRSRKPSIPSAAVPFELEVLIPAHNEESTIAATLASLEPGTAVLLGLDHCTDSTEAVARRAAREAGLELRVLRNEGRGGKWRMITRLVEQSRAPWIALVECGAVWRAGLTAAFKRAARGPGIAGVAPSYLPKGSGGGLEAVFWRIEQRLKSWESRAGGPASVYGATALYRRDRALEAVVGLRGEAWLNDEEVIPLWLRLQHPEERIVYLASSGRGAWVSDSRTLTGASIEFRRRLSLAAGNLRWVQGLWIPAWRRSAEVSLISSRRFARTLWAYWVFFVTLGGVVLAASLAHPKFHSVQQSFGAALLALSLGAAFAFARYDAFRRWSVEWLSAALAPWAMGQGQRERPR